MKTILSGILIILLVAITFPLACLRLEAKLRPEAKLSCIWSNLKKLFNQVP